MFGLLLQLGLNFQQAEKFQFLARHMVDHPAHTEDAKAFQKLLKLILDFDKT
jgi:hypothetical protein